MTQNEYNNYTNSIVDENITMPYLCGGYTQTDWDMVSGKLVDLEYIENYVNTPSEVKGYINWVTKPYWA